MAGARAGSSDGREPKSGRVGRKIQEQLSQAGLRVSGDYRAEKIGAKIRDAQLELIPYMFIIGGREAEEGKVSVRDRLEGDLGPMPIEKAMDKLKTEIRDKTIRQVAKGQGVGVRG